MTSTSLIALNEQLATETDGLCSLLWQAVYSGETLGPVPHGEIVEACLESLSILAGTTGLEHLNRPVTELRLLVAADNSSMDIIEACLARVAGSAQWGHSSVLDQVGVEST